jgi:hypothetical protein
MSVLCVRLWLALLCSERKKEPRRCVVLNQRDLQALPGSRIASGRFPGRSHIIGHLAALHVVGLDRGPGLTFYVSRTQTDVLLSSGAVHVPVRCSIGTLTEAVALSMARSAQQEHVSTQSGVINLSRLSVP